MIAIVPLIVKTDYSLLKSMITIKNLISYLKNANIKSCAITDNNLFGCIEFYEECKKNDIKPIIGLEVKFLDKFIYLYAKDYLGYTNLLKINTLIQKKEIASPDLEIYNQQVLCIIPYNNNELYNDLIKIFKNVYISYATEFEMNNALIITKNIVYANNLINAINFADTKYLRYLEMINNGKTITTSDHLNYETNCLEACDFSDESSDLIANLCNLEIPYDQKYIPHYDENISDSYKYLINLTKLGMKKRLQKEIPQNYLDRLKYELEIINKMGFVDYFLIVYDYVKYAKCNNVLVGPGRGSAAGSLVAYALGIINIDPLQYNLLFERFLNPERITMPDIDIDFEYTKRDFVIEYVKSRYGHSCVAPIITFGTLKSKQAIRDTARVMELDSNLTNKLASFIDARETISENLKTNKNLIAFMESDNLVKDVISIALKIENLKRNISTHASGIVISSKPIDSLIPVCLNDNNLMTGITMNYLENLGLLKMDFLALRNLTIIQNVLDLIKENTKKPIDLNKIPLDDKATLKMFSEADTIGIFQYESDGMISFLRKLKSSSFNDLVAAVALFRPGPMENIDTFIKRKEGREKVLYPHDSLESILKDTYGIIVYQEQIMQILVYMASFSFAEADNIRRAMSKKKKEIIESYKEQFIKQAIKNGYLEKTCLEVYDLILKFANYGFNKSHAVSYALIGYQMGYLKSIYPHYFITNLLNMSIGSEIKTKEYLDEGKKFDIKIYKPDINKSINEYIIKEKHLLLPFSIIKNVGEMASVAIVLERLKGEYKDFFDFVARTYGKSVTKKTIEALIDASAFDSFKYNHQTLYNNIDNAITYAEIADKIDESLVMKPEIEEVSEFSEGILMQRELNVFGFYVSNHPASKYNDKKIIKLKDIKNYFDKYIMSVVVINSIKVIKTKNGEDMAFLSASDETGTTDFIVFPKKNNLIEIIKIGDLVAVHGQVTKRLNKYQIVITNIERKI